MPWKQRVDAKMIRAVREVARVVVVYVGLVSGGNLAQTGTVGAYFPDLPAVLRTGHRDEHLAGVEMQVDVAHEYGPLGFEEGRECAIRRHGVHDADFIVVPGARNRAVALPVLRKAHVAFPPFDQQQALEMEQGIGEQGLALQRGRLGGRFAKCGFRARLSIEDGLTRLPGNRVHLGNAFDKGLAIGVLAGIGCREIGDRAPQRFKIDPVQELGVPGGKTRALEKGQPARVVGGGLLLFQPGRLVLEAGCQVAHTLECVIYDAFLGGGVSGDAEPVKRPIAAGTLLEPLSLPREIGSHLAPDGVKPFVGDREIERMPAAAVEDLHEDLVLALFERQRGFVLVGSGHPRHIVRNDLLAVEPDLESVIAAKEGHELHRRGRGDGAEKIRRVRVAAGKIDDRAVLPAGLRHPYPLVVGRPGLQINALLGEQRLGKSIGLERACGIPRASIVCRIVAGCLKRRAGSGHGLGPCIALGIKRRAFTGKCYGRARYARQKRAHTQDIGLRVAHGSRCPSVLRRRNSARCRAAFTRSSNLSSMHRARRGPPCFGMWRRPAACTGLFPTTWRSEG